VRREGARVRVGGGTGCQSGGGSRRSGSFCPDHTTVQTGAVGVNMLELLEVWLPGKICAGDIGGPVSGELGEDG